MPGCQRIPQRRHVELVANSETGNTGLKKSVGFACLARSLCHSEVCPVRDYSVPGVPRQEKNFWRRHCSLVKASVLVDCLTTYDYAQIPLPRLYENLFCAIGLSFQLFREV